MVSENAVPPEVVTYLNKQLHYTPPVQALPPRTVPMPTAEEKAKLREESLKVPDELAAPERTPEEIAELEARQNAPVEPAPDVVEAPLTEDDFDDGWVPNPKDLPHDDPTVTRPESEVPPQASMTPEAASKKSISPVSSDFLESVSIHTAPLEDLVAALANRFGVYTVYLGKLPEIDEINPLTGETFTKYHLGIAYQAAIKARATGLLDKPAEAGQRAIDEGRAASQNFHVDTPPQTMGEARRMNTFDYRTSPQGTQSIAQTEIVHEKGADGQMHAVQREIPAGELGSSNGAQSKYDAEEDEPLVQPNFSGRPVIRPDW